MKNRTREICTSGTVRDEGVTSSSTRRMMREDRGNVGIIRSPIRASILPDRLATYLGANEIASSAADGKTIQSICGSERVPARALHDVAEGWISKQRAREV